MHQHPFHYCKSMNESKTLKLSTWVVKSYSVAKLKGDSYKMVYYQFGRQAEWMHEVLWLKYVRTL